MKQILREFFGRPETDEQDEQGPPKRPEIEIPDDFEDEQDFLTHMRKEFYEDVSYDRLNREASIEDLKFTVGDQWDDFVRQRREAARKPVMTVNRLPAFIAQIVGARRQNETDIKLVPDNGGTKKVAEIREGLIRNIQKESRADIAYDAALQNSAICGIGNFKIDLDYESDDVFDQKIMVAPSHDALSIVWDRKVMDPTGRDARHVFDVEMMTKDEFYRRWPWATPSDLVVDVTLRGDLRMNGWIAIDDVRIVNYWRLRTRKRTLAMLNDEAGTVLDITDLTDKKHPGFNLEKAQQVMSQIATRDDGSPIMREVDKPYAEMYICSGLDVLEGPYRLNISRVPIFRVPGWEVYIGEWKHRWGLIRFMKDPQRMHNFWRSAWAEKLMQTPRGVWIAAASAVMGRENAFRQSHLSDDPLLIYNDDAAKAPERLPPAQIEAAFAEMSEITTQDLKDVSNIHEANLGMPSNEVSGAAIQARQRVSDTGTIVYHDNLTLAQEECGRTINELIPQVYDTPRVIKTLGRDHRYDAVEVNKVGEPNTDITVGKYAVTAKTGPTFATKRLEASENMMTLINAMPQTAALIADLLVEAQDWPMADEIARRLRMVLPPGVLDQTDMTPEEQARNAQVQQGQQQQAELQQRMAMAAYLKTSSETALNNARAENYSTESRLAPARTNTEAMTAASQAADREARSRLEAVRVADGR